MKRHLIWIIAGAAAIGVTAPALAAVQSGGTPDDNGIPGEIRGNCDEAEHLLEPGCLHVVVPSATAPTTIEQPVSSTTAITTAITTATTVSTPDTSTGGSVPDDTIDDSASGASVPSNTVADGPAGTVPDDSTGSSVPGDISGPCDEAEHANDPRCTGSAAGAGDDSGHRGGDDDGVDDRSGHGGDDGADDHSGRGGDDDGADDSSGHGGDRDGDDS
ncbi:MAG: hypothetical protein AB7Q42_03205 [Acidimicrobiia bacterium]